MTLPKILRSIDRASSSLARSRHHKTDELPHFLVLQQDYIDGFSWPVRPGFASGFTAAHSHLQSKIPYPGLNQAGGT